MSGEPPLTNEVVNNVNHLVSGITRIQYLTSEKKDPNVNIVCDEAVQSMAKIVQNAIGLIEGGAGQLDSCRQLPYMQQTHRTVHIEHGYPTNMDLNAQQQIEPRHSQENGSFKHYRNPYTPPVHERSFNQTAFSQGQFGTAVPCRQVSIPPPNTQSPYSPAQPSIQQPSNVYIPQATQNASQQYGPHVQPSYVQRQPNSPSVQYTTNFGHPVAAQHGPTNTAYRMAPQQHPSNMQGPTNIAYPMAPQQHPPNIQGPTNIAYPMGPQQHPSNIQGPANIAYPSAPQHSSTNMQGSTNIPYRMVPQQGPSIVQSPTNMIYPVAQQQCPTNISYPLPSKQTPPLSQYTPQQRPQQVSIRCQQNPQFPMGPQSVVMNYSAELARRRIMNENVTFPTFQYPVNPMSRGPPGYHNQSQYICQQYPPQVMPQSENQQTGIMSPTAQIVDDSDGIEKNVDAQMENRCESNDVPVDSTHKQEDSIKIAEQQEKECEIAQVANLAQNNNSLQPAPAPILEKSDEIQKTNQDSQIKQDSNENNLKAELDHKQENTAEQPKQQIDAVASSNLMQSTTSSKSTLTMDDSLKKRLVSPHKILNVSVQSAVNVQKKSKQMSSRRNNTAVETPILGSSSRQNSENSILHELDSSENKENIKNHAVAEDTDSKENINPLYHEACKIDTSPVSITAVEDDSNQVPKLHLPHRKSKNQRAKKKSVKPAEQTDGKKIWELKYETVFPDMNPKVSDEDDEVQCDTNWNYHRHNGRGKKGGNTKKKCQPTRQKPTTSSVTDNSNPSSTQKNDESSSTVVHDMQMERDCIEETLTCDEKNENSSPLQEFGESASIALNDTGADKTETGEMAPENENIVRAEEEGKSSTHNSKKTKKAKKSELKKPVDGCHSAKQASGKAKANRGWTCEFGQDLKDFTSMNKMLNDSIIGAGFTNDYTEKAKCLSNLVKQKECFLTRPYLYECIDAYSRIEDTMANVGRCVDYFYHNRKHRDKAELLTAYEEIAAATINHVLLNEPPSEKYAAYVSVSNRRMNTFVKSCMVSQLESALLGVMYLGTIFSTRIAVTPQLKNTIEMLTDISELYQNIIERAYNAVLITRGLISGEEAFEVDADFAPPDEMRKVIHDCACVAEMLKGYIYPDYQKFMESEEKEAEVGKVAAVGCDAKKEL